MQDSMIFVSNIDSSVTPEELKEEFSYFGVVKYAKIIKGKRTGFVKMLRTQDAARALLGLNGIELKGREIKVEIARPRRKS